MAGKYRKQSQLLRLLFPSSFLHVFCRVKVTKLTDFYENSISYFKPGTDCFM